MHNYSAQQHVLDIKEVFSKAAKTKESALKFLTDAGIIPAQTSKLNHNSKTVTAKKK